jgi:hypothetical protein
METTTVRLEGVSPDFLRSPIPERRKRALQILARNEGRLYGKTTQETEMTLRDLEHER